MSNITVTLFRVSADSKYLDCQFSCPATYRFIGFELEVRHFNENGNLVSDWYTLDTALFDTVTSKHKPVWSIRIPLEKLGISYPAIYIGHLKDLYYSTECSSGYEKNKYGFYILTNYSSLTLESNATFEEGMNFASNKIKKSDGTYVDTTLFNSTWFIRDLGGSSCSIYSTTDSTIPSKKACEACLSEHYPTTEEITLETDMICSDVNKVYECILGDILNNCNVCKALPDDTITKYLMLYGHVAAMQNRQYDMAEEYYKQLINCFNICGSGCGCHSGMSRSSSERTCACQSCLSSSSSSSSQSSCNCGR